MKTAAASPANRIPLAHMDAGEGAGDPHQEEWRFNPTGSQPVGHSSHVASGWSGRFEEESKMQIVRPLRHRRAAYAHAARELHLWLLQVMAWIAARVRLPRVLRLDFQEDIRKARRDIRMLIFLSMCSRMTFRRDRQIITRRPNGIAGYRHRRLRLLRAYTRGIPLHTVRDMRDALENFDKVVKRAIANLPKNGVTPGAVVTVIAVMIALGASAPTPAAEAADTS